MGFPKREKMKNRFRRFILILSVFVMTLSLFTNCDRPATDSTSVESRGNGANYNGGGHSGKVQYLFTNADEIPCLSQDRRLEVENGATRAFTFGCSGETETPFIASELLTLSHDPLFVIYQERIYAHESLLTVGKNEKAEFQYFCTDSRSLDFAIRFTRIQTPTGPETRTLGYLIRGSSGSEPEVAASSGRISDPARDGSRTYQAASGLYRVEFGKPINGSRAQGEIVFKTSGDRLSVDCFMKAKIGSDAP
jgi:hypothetical protein